MTKQTRSKRSRYSKHKHPFIVVPKQPGLVHRISQIAFLDTSTLRRCRERFSKECADKSDASQKLKLLNDYLGTKDCPVTEIRDRHSRLCQSAFSYAQFFLDQGSEWQYSEYGWLTLMAIHTFSCLLLLRKMLNNGSRLEKITELVSIELGRLDWFDAVKNKVPRCDDPNDVNMFMDFLRSTGLPDYPFHR